MRWVIAVVVLAAAALSLVAHAGFSLNGDYEYEGEDYDEYEVEGSLEELGSAALYGGVFFTLGYMAVKRLWRPLGLPPRVLRLALDAHSYGNAAAAAAAAAHGIANIQYAGPVEYAMAALILALSVSGAVMRYAKWRGAKIAARQLHSQRLLAAALLVLALIHAETMD